MKEHMGDLQEIFHQDEVEDDDEDQESVEPQQEEEDDEEVERTVAEMGRTDQPQWEALIPPEDVDFVNWQINTALNDNPHQESTDTVTTTVALCDNQSNSDDESIGTTPMTRIITSVEDRERGVENLAITGRRPFTDKARGMVDEETRVGQGQGIRKQGRLFKLLGKEL